MRRVQGQGSRLNHPDAAPVQVGASAPVLISAATNLRSIPRAFMTAACSSPRSAAVHFAAAMAATACCRSTLMRRTVTKHFYRPACAACAMAV